MFMFKQNGTVKGICMGTGIQPNVSAYNARGTDFFQSAPGGAGVCIRAQTTNCQHFFSCLDCSFRCDVSGDSLGCCRSCEARRETVKSWLFLPSQLCDIHTTMYGMLKSSTACVLAMFRSNASLEGTAHTQLDVRVRSSTPVRVV